MGDYEALGDFVADAGVAAAEEDACAGHGGRVSISWSEEGSMLSVELVDGKRELEAFYIILCFLRTGERLRNLQDCSLLPSALRLISPLCGPQSDVPSRFFVYRNLKLQSETAFLKRLAMSSVAATSDITESSARRSRFSNDERSSAELALFAPILR